MVDQQAKVVRKVMGRTISDRPDHQSLLPRPVANIAVPCLTLLLIGGPSEPAAMASVLHLLAILVYSNGALRALLDGVAHFRKIAEACGTGGSKVVLRAFIEFRFFVKYIFFKMGECLDSVEFLFRKIVVLVCLYALVVVEEIDGGLYECLAQVLDDEDFDVLAVEVGVGLGLGLAVMKEVLPVEAFPHLLEDLVLELVVDLAEGEDLELDFSQEDFTVAELLSQGFDKSPYTFPGLRSLMIEVVLIVAQKPHVFGAALPRFIISVLAQQ